MEQNPHHVVGLSQVYKEDEDLVGKKAHELGMLWKLGVPLPNGFVITTEFFKEFLRATGIDKKIKKIHDLSHPAILDSLKKLLNPIQQQILKTHIPQNLSIELHKFYRIFFGILKDKPLNIFSSSSNHKSLMFPNVKGDANLILKIKTIWSMSLEEPIAIVVQESIKFDTRGKVFTDSPDVNRDLTEAQISKLINYCKIIQNHFYFPKEIEYCVSKDVVVVTKINPFTGIVTKPNKPEIKKNYIKNVLIKGIPINPGIVTGVVKVLYNQYGTLGVKKGEIIITNSLNPSIFKKIKNAKAVIIDSVSSNSLDKTLYRKYFQIPTIEGVKNATKIFRNGNVITVNGISGEIYSGGLVY